MRPKPADNQATRTFWTAQGNRIGRRECTAAYAPPADEPDSCAFLGPPPVASARTVAATAILADPSHTRKEMAPESRPDVLSDLR